MPRALMLLLNFDPPRQGGAATHRPPMTPSYDPHVPRFTALILALLMVLAACEKKAPAPPPSQSSAGPRIVSISPAVGIMLVDLHYDHLCVGRDGHDLALHPSIPIVGDQHRIDYEALIAAHPTHVFTQWGSRDLPARLVELAETNHWKLIDSRLLSLDDISETTTQ